MSRQLPATRHAALCRLLPLQVEVLNNRFQVLGASAGPHGACQALGQALQRVWEQALHSAAGAPALAATAPSALHLS